MTTTNTRWEDGVATASRLTAAHTTIHTLALEPGVVFNTLADIERLPRWAGGFCERLYLARGRWTGLTSLGELTLETETDGATRTVTLRAGWDETERRGLTLHVTAASAGGTRVMLRTEATEDELQARLAEAIRVELRRWVAEMGGGVFPGGAARAG